MGGRRGRYPSPLLFSKSNYKLRDSSSVTLQVCVVSCVSSLIVLHTEWLRSPSPPTMYSQSILGVSRSRATPTDEQPACPMHLYIYLGCSWPGLSSPPPLLSIPLRIVHTPPSQGNARTLTWIGLLPFAFRFFSAVVCCAGCKRGGAVLKEKQKKVSSLTSAPKSYSNVQCSV